MLTPSRRYWLLSIAAFAILAFALLSLRQAISWYGHPFAGVLLDPDGQVSSFGLPTWDGFQQGLRYPDEILTVDGNDLGASPDRSPASSAERPYRADVWDRAVATAARLGHPTVHVRARTAGDVVRELDLHISRLDPLAFWLDGAANVVIALLYGAGALIALAASPRGRLARTFAKTTLFAALFLLTLFDYHTTRRFVPLFHLAFAMVPMGFFALPLRLPDDVALLRRRPWIVGALDALGLVLGLAMVAAHLLGGTTVALRSVCTALFGASFFFFAGTFLVRFARARGDRRATLRALLVAMVPTHVVIGSAFVLGSLSQWGVPIALLAVPALALTPLSSVVALIRHDLWGSRALLSRVLVRAVIVVVTCAVAVALGTGVAALFNVDLAGALLASSVAGTVAGLLVDPALRFGDQALFPSRGVYKPTVEQLSEELTVITVPEEVGHAVERTVRRWLPCDEVEFCPAGDGAGAPRDEGVSGIHALTLRPPALSSAPPPARPTSAAAPRIPADPRDDLRIDVLFRGVPLAVLRVGKKRGGALFTSEDVDLLQTIANQAALALAHAYSYAELELRRRQQAAAWRGEREALVETVAAEIAHEIRYPINYFRSLFRRGQADLSPRRRGRRHRLRRGRAPGAPRLRPAPRLHPPPGAPARHRRGAGGQGRAPPARSARRPHAGARALGRRGPPLRSGSGDAGPRQPHRQRARRRRRGGPGGRHLRACTARRAAHGVGQRRRHRGRVVARVRALVHYQAPGHRPRPGDHPPHRAGSWLDHRARAARGADALRDRDPRFGHRRARE